MLGTAEPDERRAGGSRGSARDRSSRRMPRWCSVASRASHGRARRSLRHGLRVDRCCATEATLAAMVVYGLVVEVVHSCRCHDHEECVRWVVSSQECVGRMDMRRGRPGRDRLYVLDTESRRRSYGYAHQHPMSTARSSHARHARRMHAAPMGRQLYQRRDQRRERRPHAHGRSHRHRRRFTLRWAMHSRTSRRTMAATRRLGNSLTVPAAWAAPRATPSRCRCARSIRGSMDR